jgi:hypothetical protein
MVGIDVAKGWHAQAEALTADGWCVRAVFAEDAGGPVISELHITKQPRKRLPAGGLTSRRLRGLTRVGGAFAVVRPTSHFLASGLDDPVRTLIHSEIQQRGRQSTPAAQIVRVAAAYAQLVQSGCRAPNRELARELRYSVTRIRDLVKLAREKGYLTPTKPGRMGGTITPEAFAVLEPNATPSTSNDRTPVARGE